MLFIPSIVIDYISNVEWAQTFIKCITDIGTLNQSGHFAKRNFYPVYISAQTLLNWYQKLLSIPYNFFHLLSEWKVFATWTQILISFTSFFFFYYKMKLEQTFTDNSLTKSYTSSNSIFMPWFKNCQRNYMLA